MNEPGPASNRLTTQNPWPGLRAFTEGDRDFFFGREHETAELLSLVQRASVTVLYGQSGLGKTSLLQAGAFPELKNLNFLPFRLRFNHDETAPPLAQQIKDALTTHLDGAQIEAPRPRPDETLWEYFHRRDVDFWGPRNRLLTPVMVLDQFEEAFTLGQRSDATSARVTEFAAELEALLEHRPPSAVREWLDAHPENALHFDLQRHAVKFVVSLREDFLPQLDTWRTRMPSLLPHRFRLERMTGAQALEVVQRAGRDLVEPAVARDIVDFVSASQRRRLVRAMEQRDVEPALLSVVCDELNRRRIERGQDNITADVLSGEREGIIQRFYDRAFKNIDDRVRDWVEDQLLTSSGYRDRGALEDALKSGLPEAAFDQLVDRRILHREEREGVVWLELTHDLLSDPATQSRTLRQQRRQAEAAAAREAEFARQLRRSRFMVAVFAVLLVATGLGLIFVVTEFNMWKRAEAERDKATAKANAEARNAEESLKTAVGTADALSSLMDYVRSDMRVPSGAVRTIIEIGDDSYRNSRQQSPSSDLRLRHARFLAKAADALYQSGHFDAGIKEAERSLELVRDSDIAASAAARLTRAEAHYGRGSCYSVTGRLSEAVADFDKASQLAHDTYPPELQNAATRVFVQSQIGMGRVEVQEFALAEASLRYRRTLGFLTGSGLPKDDAAALRASALLGMGLSEAQSSNKQRWFAEADDIVMGLMRRNGENLRWRRLSAELGYMQGFALLNLDQPESAAAFFRRARDVSEELHRHDPGNLDWKLSLVQATRGLGEFHLSRGEWDSAQKTLEDAEKHARELNEAQPLWTQARFLRGASMYAQADLIQRKYFDSPKEWKTLSDFDKAFSKFAEAQRVLEGSVRAAPKNLEFVRSLFWTIAYEGLMRRYTNKHAEALGFYQKAGTVLVPLERAHVDNQQLLSIKSTLARWTADSEKSLKRTAEALQHYQQSVSLRKELAQRSHEPDDYYALSIAESAFGDLYSDLKQNSEAYKAYSLAVEDVNKALLVHPKDTYFLGQSASVESKIASLRLEQHDLTGSFDALNEAIAGTWKVLQEDYSDPALNKDLDDYLKRARQLASTPSDTSSGGADHEAVASKPDAALLGKIGDLVKHSDPNKLLDRYGQSSWPLDPLIPGNWQTLTSTELETARHQISEAAKNLPPEHIRQVRRLALDFYDNGTLYEAEIVEPKARARIISCVQRGKDIVMLDGTSIPIHKMNRASPPILDSRERATNYLRFFIGAIRADEGRFVLVDHARDLHWSSNAPAKTREDLIPKIKPLIVEPKPHFSHWSAIGTLQYGNNLFVATLQLSRVGYVEMARDNPIAEHLPLQVEDYVQGGRILEDLDDIHKRNTEAKAASLRDQIRENPKDEKALEQLLELYDRLKRWKDAAEAQKGWVSFVEERAKDDAKWREKLPREYTRLSWYQVLARDFSGALASSETGLRMGEYLPLETNRAHALLFLGRTQEAEELYLRYRGTLITPTSKKKWETVILEDFDSLKEAGLMHPEIDNLRKLLKPE